MKYGFSLHLIPYSKKNTSFYISFINLIGKFIFKKIIYKFSLKYKIKAK